jgi:hypothetical protein
MPKQNWEEIETSGGSYAAMTPGGYIAKIMSAEDVPEKQYVKVLYDIAEGDFAGHYSADFWADRDNAHCIYMSYKSEAALSFTKRRLEAISFSNGCFDAFAAFDADNWSAFVNKRFGLVMGDEEYIAKDKSVKISLRAVGVVTVDDIVSMNYHVPPLKCLQPSTAAPAFVEVLDEDIPF